MYECVIIAKKSIDDKEPLSDGSAQKKSNQYNLRSQESAIMIKVLI